VLLAINLEALSVPTAPYPLLDFNDPETATWMKTMSDASLGGNSTANLTQVPPTDTDPAHILFHGNISTELPPNRPEVQRTGYAAFRNQDRGRSLFGQLFWNVDPYMYLALRLKSDGRRYLVNIQTDSIVETDIHQHRLYTKHHKGADGPDDPGSWETVLIKFHEFVRTNHGVVTEPQSEMLRQKVRSFGIGLIDRQDGPFNLAIGALWATNLNERGQIDGRTNWQEGDQGSAKLSEVTVEKLAQRAEEKRNLPTEARSGFRDTIPSHFGRMGKSEKGRPASSSDASTPG
jgi:NADH dehydrogenase [ubiquinone] 1 alpha subcomplex assembly factor 1